MPVVKPAQENAAAVAARLRALEKAKHVEETRGAQAAQQVVNDGSAFVDGTRRGSAETAPAPEEWFVETLQSYFSENQPKPVTHAQVKALREMHDIAAAETLLTVNNEGASGLILTAQVRSALRAIEALESGLDALAGTELKYVMSPDYLVELKENWRGSAQLDFQAVVSEMKVGLQRDWSREGHVVVPGTPGATSTEDWLKGLWGPPEFVEMARELADTMKALANSDGSINVAAWTRAHDLINRMSATHTDDARLLAFYNAFKTWLGPSLDILRAFPDLKLP